MKKFKNTKIYIAGHNGMVGNALLRYFKEIGFKKIYFATKKKLNLLNQSKVENFIKLKKPEVIINCAGKVGGILANSTYPVEFLNENIFIQLNLINSAYKHKVKHFINLGSSCIYPKNSKQPIRESYLLNSELEKTNEEIEVIDKSNSGHGSTILQGYQQSKGDWIFQTDSDNEIRPDQFKKVCSHWFRSF